MQAQKDVAPDFQCKDKFLLQSVVAEYGATTKDITSEMFNKGPGKVLEEFKLPVVYIPASPPSPVPKESEEGSSPRSSMLENGTQSSFLFDAVSRSSEEPPKEKPLEELLRKGRSKNHGSGFSIMFMVSVGLLGILVGYT